MRSGVVTIDRVVGVVALALATAAPLYLPGFWIGTLLTQMLFLGVVAASLIFLSAYGGMVSLAQVAIYGTAGFVVGNLTTNGNTKGLNLGWDPWWGVVVGIAIATAIGVIVGLLSSRSVGIYFLMITLTFSVIANLFFGQVTDLSGFGGISGIPVPALIGNADAHQNRLYYVALVVALGVYVLLRYLSRTPFGLALQGVRDDPVRMSSLGYSPALHRTAAFGVGAFIAAVGGVLFVWWNGHIDPASIDLGATIDVLVIAVVGGLFRLEGAWIGALFFVVIHNYFQQINFTLGNWISQERFDTLIGLVFLLIILVSPGGLIGIWERALSLLPGARRRGPDDRDRNPIEVGAAEPSI